MVAAAFYAYFEFKDIAQQRQQSRKDGSIPTMIIRAPSPRQSALWMTVYHHKNPQSVYLDLSGDGRLFALTENQSEKSARRNVVPEETVRRAFETVRQEAVLKVVDPDPGEKLFSDAEWVQGGFRADDGLRTFGPATVGSYPEEMQSILKDLRNSAHNGDPAEIERLVVAEPVQPLRKQSIEKDPRAMYSFVQMRRESLPVSVQLAVAHPGRKIPVQDQQEIPKIEELRMKSNLKNMGWDFFVTTFGQSFQLQMLPGTKSAER